jgi:hypothetical protein
MTTYHYRVVAKSDAGTSIGAAVAFTTAGVSLTTPAQRVVYGHALMLSGTVPTMRPGELVIVLAPGIRRRDVQSDRHCPDHERWGLAIPGAAEDRHLLPGELEPRPQPDRSRWSEAGRVVPPNHRRNVRHTRLRRPIVRRPRRPAPAKDVDGTLGDCEASPPRVALRGDVPRIASSREAPRCDERQPGRPGLPCRIQPDDRLPPHLSRNRLSLRAKSAPTDCSELSLCRPWVAGSIPARPIHRS